MTQHRCLLCSQTLLRHIRHGKLYWFCRHCYQEMPIAQDGFDSNRQGTATAGLTERKQPDSSRWQHAESELEKINTCYLSPSSHAACPLSTRETVIQQLEVALARDVQVSDNATSNTTYSLPVNSTDNIYNISSHASDNTAPSRQELSRVADYLYKLREECDRDIRLIHDLLKLHPDELHR